MQEIPKKKSTQRFWYIINEPFKVHPRNMPSVLLQRGGLVSAEEATDFYLLGNRADRVTHLPSAIRNYQGWGIIKQDLDMQSPFLRHASGPYPETQVKAGGLWYIDGTVSSKKTEISIVQAGANHVAYLEPEEYKGILHLPGFIDVLQGNACLTYVDGHFVIVYPVDPFPD